MPTTKPIQLTLEKEPYKAFDKCYPNVEEHVRKWVYGKHTAYPVIAHRVRGTSNVADIIVISKISQFKNNRTCANYEFCICFDQSRLPYDFANLAKLVSGTDRSASNRARRQIRSKYSALVRSINIPGRYSYYCLSSPVFIELELQEKIDPNDPILYAFKRKEAEITKVVEFISTLKKTKETKPRVKRVKVIIPKGEEDFNVV